MTVVYILVDVLNSADSCLREAPASMGCRCWPVISFWYSLAQLWTACLAACVRDIQWFKRWLCKITRPSALGLSLHDFSSWSAQALWVVLGCVHQGLDSFLCSCSAWWHAVCIVASCRPLVAGSISTLTLVTMKNFFLSLIKGLSVLPIFLKNHQFCWFFFFFFLL